MRPRAHGMAAFLSSTLDGPWGIAAALQLAAAEDAQARLRARHARAVRRAASRRALPRPRAAGRCRCRAGPGLGVEVDEDALAEVLVERIEL